MVRGFWVSAAPCLLACALTPACQCAEQERTENGSATALEQGLAPTLRTETGGAEGSEQLAAAPSASSAQGARNAVRLDVRSGKVPEDWPSEVPIYPGAKVEMSMKTEQGVLLALSTPDAAARLTEFYQARLAGMRGGSAGRSPAPTLRWSDDAKPLHVTLAFNPRPGPPTRVTLVASRERGPRAY